MFFSWITTKSLSAGDWPYLFPENIAEFSFPPKLSFIWLTPFYQLTAKFFVQYLGLSWEIAEKIIWFWPFLILAVFSSWYLAKTLFPKEKIIHFFSPFIYLFNTYILMVVGGGQMGIALAYALAPLVFGVLVKLSPSSVIRDKLVIGLILAFQVMYDPRIASLTVVAVVFYLLLTRKAAFFGLIIPLIFAVLLNAHWWLPLFLMKQPALPMGYGEVGWVEFLSFGNFSDSISFLHPNWPENIFGKTYFMRPEFLLLPILVFISLLFIDELKNSRIKKNILFFAFLALIGAFLAKGSKPPFGGIYLWLFNHFPGMKMFRDPTKFYLLVALSYSFLIPFSLKQISQRLKKITRVKYLVFGIFILYWLFLIRPAWLGQLGGTFKAKEVPQEYIVLKDFIHNQEESFRTLWIPKRQRFGFSSNNHPAIENPELFSEEEIVAQEVKYIIIPFDSEEEIFLEDRKYDYQQRLALEKELDEIPWLKKIDITDKIAVYELTEKTSN